MPLYEYGCEKCGKVVEKLQSSPDAPAPSQCPTCGATGSMTRLISNTSFQLKGSGWYVTDYGGTSRSPSSTEGEASPAAASTDAGESKKSADSASTSSSDGGATSGGD